MTSGPFRVVHHPTAAGRFRVLKHPYTAYESAARAALGGMLATQGPQSQLGLGGNDSLGSSSANDAEQGALSELGFGLPDWMGTHKSRYGFRVPNMYNEALGTELGAHLQQTGAGRQILGMIGAQHSGPGGATYASLFGPGGRLYGRGTTGQWVSGGTGGTSGGGGGSEPQSGSGRPLPHGESEAEKEAYSQVGELLASVVTGELVGGSLAGKAVEDWGWHTKTAARAGAIAGFVAMWLVNKLVPSGGSGGGSGGSSGTKMPVGPSGPVTPSPNAGYYPAGTGPGRSSGPAMMSNVMRAFLVEAIRRMHQQANDQASSSGGGGGTSIAPERLFLHGMKHPYDWVAMRRIG